MMLWGEVYAWLGSDLRWPGVSSALGVETFGRSFRRGRRPAPSELVGPRAERIGGAPRRANWWGPAPSELVETCGERIGGDLRRVNWWGPAPSGLVEARGEREPLGWWRLELGGVEVLTVPIQHQCPDLGMVAGQGLPDLLAFCHAAGDRVGLLLANLL